MKYESTILKRLIDTYGVVGNPRYISEIIKEFIVRGKERFPELFTYQADWLAHIDEFGLNPSYTVSYTGQSIYAPNTLERPVKSAILNGQTLVDLCDKMIVGSTSFDVEMTYSSNAKSYFVIIESNTAIIEVGLLESQTSWNVRQSVSNLLQLKIKLTPDTTKDIFRFRCIFRNPDLTPINAKCMLIEYQEGMENWDIPYFEGMKSVQMPGLKTTGENLIDESNMIIGEGVNSSTGIFTTDATRKRSDFIRFDSTSIYSEGLDSIFCYDENKNYLGRINTTNSTDVLTDTKFVVCRSFKETENIMLSSSQTPYKPYQSNILTVNEPVELRKVGNIQDELNLLTGELTKRIGEIVLDGSEGWTWYKETTNTIIVYTTNPLPNHLGAKYTNSQMVTNYLDIVGSIESDKDGCYISNTGKLNLAISKTKATSVNELKQYLQSTPLVVQYLQTESVKTVDLTILDQNGQNVKQLMSFNGGTYFNTRSSEGSPLPMVSVSVETDLEETLKMCSLDGNTM